jgi:hypothetical protein
LRQFSTASGQDFAQQERRDPDFNARPDINLST